MLRTVPRSQVISNGISRGFGTRLAHRGLRDSEDDKYLEEKTGSSHSVRTRKCVGREDGRVVRKGRRSWVDGEGRSIQSGRE